MPTGPITKKVIKLCQEIAVDPQFCKYRKNVLEFIENKDQNSEYFDLLDYQSQLEEKSEKGETISPEEIEKLEELGVKAFSNPASVDFMHGQDALEQLQELVDNAISYVVEHGEAPSAKYLHELDED
jgi:cell fate (sporulation/competence/biofilm development) regulator YlbF (YheA/YmcA/DUF963 family)